MQLIARKSVLALLAALIAAPVTFSWGSIVTQYDWQEAEKKVTGDLCDTQDKDFDGFRYQESIPHCRRNVAPETKRLVAQEFGIFEDYDQFEIDHYIPLSIGGSNEVANLWPLPVPVARAKSALEGKIHEQVKEGALTQEQAIERVRNWKSFINLN